MSTPNTATDLAVFVGAQGDLLQGEMRIRVRIVNARKVWSRVDYLVTPVAGSGEQWVAAGRVESLSTAEATR